MIKTKNSRREFGFKLAVMSTVGLASSKAQLLHADQSRVSQSISSQPSMEAEVFQRLLGEQFKVTDGHSTCLVRLQDVQTKCAKQTGRPESLCRRCSFTILFAPVDGQLSDQAVCRVAHPSLGDLELFLVPVGTKGKVEAVFA